MEGGGFLRLRLMGIIDEGRVGILWSGIWYFTGIVIDIYCFGMKINN